jgi:hypothetical protein
MTGAMLPLLSYGVAVTPQDCDLDFTAGSIGDATGIDTRPGHSGGTAIQVSEDWDDVFGSFYSVGALGPGFFQVIATGGIDQFSFAALTVAEWGQTFDTEDADYFQSGGDTFWTWFTNTDEFVDGNDYCVTLAF